MVMEALGVAVLAVIPMPLTTVIGLGVVTAITIPIMVVGLLGLHYFFFCDISVMVGGWIDQSLRTYGRWHFRSSSTHDSYQTKWGSAGDLSLAKITEGHNSEGFALLYISVRMSGGNMGLWSRSSAAVVDEFGVAPVGGFVVFHNHSGDRNGNSITRWDHGFANPREA